MVFDIDAAGRLNFVDEFETSDSGTGNWGVYPLLGPDRILLSDTEEGLFVMETVAGGCACPPSNPPAPDVIQAKNRYLSFSGGEPGGRQAVRVTFVDLPGAHSVLNGSVMWVGSPSDVSELGGLSDNTPPTFKAATLGCTPSFLDWNEVGTVHVSHAGIVPGGIYDIQLVEQSCNVASEASFSMPLRLTQSKWADVGGPFSAGSWTPPDTTVDVAFDIISILEGFRSLPGAPIKARVDLEPATPDRVINILDVTRALDAFRGFGYPFSPQPLPCP